MLGPPPPPAPQGAYEDTGQPPQDPVTAVIGEMRTSMLDLGTALRLGWVGRRVYYGTVTEPPQVFVSPAEENDEDMINAAVAQGGNAPRSLGKTSSSGEPSVPATKAPRASPGVLI